MPIESRTKPHHHRTTYPEQRFCSRVGITKHHTIQIPADAGFRRYLDTMSTCFKQS